MTTPSAFLKKQTDLLDEVLKVMNHNTAVNEAATAAKALETDEEATIDDFKKVYLKALHLDREHKLIKQHLPAADAIQQRLNDLTREHKQVDVPAQVVALPNTPTATVTESVMAKSITNNNDRASYDKTVSMQRTLADAVASYGAAVSEFNDNETAISDHINDCESLLRRLNLDPKTIRNPSLQGQHTKFGGAAGDAKKTGVVQLNDAAPRPLPKGPGGGCCS